MAQLKAGLHILSIGFMDNWIRNLEYRFHHPKEILKDFLLVVPIAIVMTLIILSLLHAIIW